VPTNLIYRITVILISDVHDERIKDMPLVLEAIEQVIWSEEIQML
jgi:endonuclease IV